jgi:hypothetical protein
LVVKLNTLANSVYCITWYYLQVAHLPSMGAVFWHLCRFYITGSSGRNARN